MEKELICADCGRVINADELDNCLQGKDEYGEEIIICPDCADDWEHCYNCDALVKENELYYCESNGEYYCEDCKDDYLFYCERCGNYYLESESVVVHTRYGDEYWCEDCASESAFYCEDCETYYDMRYYDSCQTRTGRYICQDCADENYYYCDNCGYYVWYEDWDSDNECCIWCAEESGGKYGDKRIKEYHNAPSMEWYGNIKKRWKTKQYYHPQFRGFGFELEVGNGEYFTECIDDIESAVGDRVYFEHDGSVSRGFEIISQPHTIEAFWENKNRWSKMLESIKENGFTSHDTGFCGLHIHFSREMFGSTEYKQNLAVAKIMYFMQYYQDDIKRISRRKNMEYCNFYDINMNWHSEKELREYFSDLASDRYNDRYRIINTRNYKTIEFRLFRGTLNEKSFFATFDFLQNIVNNSKKIKWIDVKDVSKWLKGMSKETLKYIASRYAFENELANITTEDEENYIEEVA